MFMVIWYTWPATAPHWTVWYEEFDTWGEAEDARIEHLREGKLARVEFDPNGGESALVGK